MRERHPDGRFEEAHVFDRWCAPRHRARRGGARGAARKRARDRLRSRHLQDAGAVVRRRTSARGDAAAYRARAARRIRALIEGQRVWLIGVTADRSGARAFEAEFASVTADGYPAGRGRQSQGIPLATVSAVADQRVRMLGLPLPRPAVARRVRSHQLRLRQQLRRIVARIVERAAHGALADRVVGDRA